MAVLHAGLLTKFGGHDLPFWARILSGGYRGGLPSLALTPARAKMWPIIRFPFSSAGNSCVRLAKRSTDADGNFGDDAPVSRVGPPRLSSSPTAENPVSYQLIPQALHVLFDGFVGHAGRFPPVLDAQA